MAPVVCEDQVQTPRLSDSGSVGGRTLYEAENSNLR